MAKTPPKRVQTLQKGSKMHLWPFKAWFWLFKKSGCSDRFLSFREWCFVLKNKKKTFFNRARGHFLFHAFGNENSIITPFKDFFDFFFMFFEFYRYFPRTVRNFNYLTWKMKAPHGKKGPKPLQKGSGTLFGGVFAGFLALDASKKVFEHFLIDILCCLNILNNISKIEKNHTVPLR